MTAPAPADVTAYRLGSVLSGGGSAPSPNTPAAWADMYDRFQNAALATPLGIPILYGVDAVHGHNNVHGATIFPHNIGLGATRDPALVRRIGRAVAAEMAGTGTGWNFAPCLCVARDDRWGRTYESFGETPELAASMAMLVTGLQDGTPSVLATAKHYIGDGGTAGIPLVVVLVSGRPLDVAEHLSGWDALVAAWLPGTEGQEVADVLFGDVEPTGKLPVTWMRASSQQPINDGDGKTPLFPYGFGLTYEPGGEEPGPSPDPAGRTVRPGAQSQWDTGYVIQAAVANPGSAPLTGWTVTFTVPPGHQLTGHRNAVITLDGRTATARPPGTTPPVAPGGETSFGFQATRPGGDPSLPAGYTCTP
ncbi:glycoside hydrolase family 3 N-terminal domain-containing protein [Nonomuraea ferruginea]|uniref:glycoside hydrolase family 3 N-terminal domain-containing protein n=1 Tax=Nonomuraea ferruginea TaxID=46174 RepID=UPI0022FD68E6|nr:glycoside hydrolase family 3 N-terminal domain-containing protein [Nonomuraea ferruginea]